MDKDDGSDEGADSGEREKGRSNPKSISGEHAKAMAELARAREELWVNREGRLFSQVGEELTRLPRLVPIRSWYAPALRQVKCAI